MRAVQRRPRRAVRRFRIVDGLIAIAATAVGLSWVRNDWEWLGTFDWPNWRLIRSVGPSSWIPLYDQIRTVVSASIYSGAALACPWSVALLTIRRVRLPTRPFWRARRPGALACLISTAVLALLLAAQSLRPYRDWLHVNVGRYGEFRYVSTGWYGGGERIGDLDPFLNTLLQIPRLTGFVVAGSWLALALAGRWRTEAGWIDRLGRAIGVFWIVAALYFLFLPL